MGVTEAFDKNYCQGSVRFYEEENVVHENQCHFVLEDPCKNQNWYSNNEKFVAVTKEALKNDKV